MFAQNSLAQWQEFISSVGLPGFFMISVLVLMVSVIRWAGPHVKTALEAHLKLVHALTEATEKQVDFNRRQAQSSEDTARVLAQLQAVHDPASPASSFRTNRALQHAADALFEAADDDRRPAVHPHTEAMRRELGDA